MGQSFAIDGLPGLLLLLVPVLVLALVVLWTLRQTRAKHRTPYQTGSHGSSPLPPPSAPQGDAHVTTPADRRTPDAAPEPQTLITAEPASPESTPAIVAEPVSVAAPEDFAAAIARLEKGGDQGELAHLYIRQAGAYAGQGNLDQAGSRLRDAIRVAALNGLATPHALARVELGDLYFSNGDPITACEQWQIARNLFHDLARPKDRDDVDKRMLSNGCPTDWVLTDF